MKSFVSAMAFIVIALVASESDACSRCGLFGNRCRFAVVAAPVVAHHVVPHHVEAVAAPVQYQQQPILVNNIYPQPNGAALLAQQGGTTYGIQSPAILRLTDPDLALRQAYELAKATQSLASSGVSGYNSMAALSLQLNANANDPLARGAAATSVLNAAGLNPATAQLNQGPLTIQITRDQTGALRVEQMNAGTVQQLNGNTQCQNCQPPAQSQPQGTTTPPDAPQAPGIPGTPGTSILAAKCASCHGLNLTEPKGGVFIDANQKLSCVTAMKAIRHVRRGTMPPSAKERPLPDADREALITELETLAQEALGAN